MDPEDVRVESMLKRYRPIGPPPDLRDRILGAVNGVQAPRPRRYPVRWAIAAALLLCFGMEWMTDRVNQETAALLRAPRARWTTEAEEAACLLGGASSDRRYIGFLLAIGDDLEPSTSTLGMNLNLGEPS